MTIDDMHNANLATFEQRLEQKYKKLIPIARESGYYINALIKGMAQCKTFEEQIASLERYVPYSIAKKLVNEMRTAGLIPKVKSSGTRKLYYPNM
jgi:hypothetical protein